MYSVNGEVDFAGTALGTEVKNNSTPQVISSCGAGDRGKQATTCQQNDREGQPVDSILSRSSSISNHQNLLGYGPRRDALRENANRRLTEKQKELADGSDLQADDLSAQPKDANSTGGDGLSASTSSGTEQLTRSDFTQNKAYSARATAHAMRTKTRAPRSALKQQTLVE